MPSSVQDAAKAYLRLMRAILSAETPTSHNANPDATGDAYIDALDSIDSLTGDTPAVAFVKGCALLRMAHVTHSDDGLDFQGFFGSFHRNLMPLELREAL